MSTRSMTRIFLAVGMFSVVGERAQAQDALLLRETFPSGYQYHVSTRVDLSGSLTPPTEKGKASTTVAIRGESAIEYDECVLKTEGNVVQKTGRIYRRIDFQRTVAGKPQSATIRPAVRRLVLLRNGNAEVPFSPDGPLMWGEIDQVRTDVFTPALTGLLAEKEVKPGDKWTAATPAVQELTDMERVEEGRVECRFDQVNLIDKRRHARITFTGTVRGTNEDGPNRQELDGYLYFDLESNHLSYLSLKGVSVLLDKDGKEQGRVVGRFVISRRVNTRCQELSEEGLKGVALEPNAENTRLLYDNAELGVRFQHPRRWRVAAVRGSQVVLDSPDGSGLLLTIEAPTRVPSGQQFLAESRGWLLDQKAKVLKIEPVQTVREAPALVHFALEVEVAGQRVLMDYYVATQTTGGVMIAARLMPTDQAVLQLEVERLARSVEVTRK